MRLAVRLAPLLSNGGFSPKIQGRSSVVLAIFEELIYASFGQTLPSDVLKSPRAALLVQITAPSLRTKPLGTVSGHRPKRMMRMSVP
jgi:hypothetical protein